MKPVTCAEGVVHLTDYLEGVLAAPLAATLEAHVAGCPRCQAFVASFRAAPRLLRDATEHAPTAADRERLLRVLRARRG